MAAPDVVGLTEIARRLGFTKRYVRELSEKPGFPEATPLAMGRAYSTADVEAWIAIRFPDRVAGPPAKD